VTTDPFARYGAYIYRVRWFVLAAWLVVLVVCGPLAGKAADALQAGGIEAPGSDSSIASGLLSSDFDVSALNNVAVVLRSDSLTVDDAAYESQVEVAAMRVRGAEGVTRVVHYYGTLLDTLVSEDKHTTIMFASLQATRARRRRTSKESARPSTTRSSSTTSPARRRSIMTSRLRARTI